MKWADLSIQAKEILEHCFDIITGKPKVLDIRQGHTFSVELKTIPKRVIETEIVTRSLLREIKEYAMKGSDSTLKMEQVTAKHIRISEVMPETSGAGMKWNDLSYYTQAIIELYVDMNVQYPKALDVCVGSQFAVSSKGNSYVDVKPLGIHKEKYDFARVETPPGVVIETNTITKSMILEIQEYASKADDMKLNVEYVTDSHIRICPSMPETSGA